MPEQESFMTGLLGIVLIKPADFKTIEIHFEIITYLNL